jgi:hypothetical protein
MLDKEFNPVNENLPPVQEALVNWLNEVYPDRMPSETDLLDIRYKQGQISVVKTLISIFEEQKNVLRR